MCRLALLGAFSLGDVARYGDDDPAVFGAQRAPMGLRPAPAAVFRRIGAFAANTGGAFGDDGVVLALELFAGRVEHVMRTETEEILAREPEPFAADLVHVDEAHAAAVGEVDRVERHIHGCAEALQILRAPALLLLGSLAHEELADLAADDARGLQQARVGLARVRAREAEHAQPAPVGGHRENECAAVEKRPRGARRARIFADVTHPERFAAVPDDPGEPAAALVNHGARPLEKALHSRIALSPGLGETQDASVGIRGEIAAARPALCGAHGPDHLADPGVRARRLGEAARDLVLEREQVLFALARGDFLADTAISREHPAGVKHRLAADRKVPLDPFGVDARDLEVTERKVRVHGSDFPARLPNLAARRIDGLRAAALRGAHEPVVSIGLPVEVGGEVGQAAEARFAFPQRELGHDAIGDVLGDAVVAGEHALRIEKRLPVDADVAHLTVLAVPAQQEIVERLPRLEHAPVLVPGLAQNLGAR